MIISSRIRRLIVGLFFGWGICQDMPAQQSSRWLEWGSRVGVSDIDFFSQPRAKFADTCRGFIFLKPVDKLAPCRKIKNFVTEAMFQKGCVFFETVYKRTFTSAQELNDFLEGR